MNKEKSLNILFGILSFVVPFALYWLTSSNSLGFADAGEFALVTKMGGIAHPPGFPSYVLIGWIWSGLLSIFSIHHIPIMVLFSISCMSAASFFLFQTSKKIILTQRSSSEKNIISVSFISCISSIAFCTGITAWHWANNIEVYAFHVLTMSLLLYGLTCYNFEKKKSCLIIAGIALAIGLSNHHLTIIFFIPFLFLFFRNDFYKIAVTTKKIKSKEKISIPKQGFFNIVLTREFVFFTLVATTSTIFFYVWMFWRAGEDLSFKFGSPDNFSRFFYHLTGGAWQKNTAEQVKGIVGMRFPYFMNLTAMQLFMFLPFALYGLFSLYRNKLRLLASTIILYFIIILIYQLRIDQTSDTDAYMILPFFVLSIAVVAGIYGIYKSYSWIIYVLPVLLITQVILNFPESDKRKFDVSESLMKQLDLSAPKGSVILISDWTLVSQYYYYHLAENFRSDLVVLNYDLKFTNYKMLENIYPEFYKYIKPEYDRFIQLLGEAHPQEIYNTGCSLDSDALLGSFIATVRKIQEYCTVHQYAFLCDPKAFLFLKDYKGLESGGGHMSGFFVSSIQTGIGKEFLDLPFKWLESPQVLKEPAAVDKIVDFEAALDFSRNYYRQTQDTLSYNKAENSFEKIKELQRKMKKNMAFVYRSPGSRK